MLVYDEFYDMNDKDCSLPEGTLLLNIETTGLSPRSAFVYLIGMGWQQEGRLHLRCLLAESRMDERKLMATFHKQLSNFDTVLTYGGQSFIFRFMNERWSNYSDTPIGCDETSDLFEEKRTIDIQKDIAPYRDYLSLSDTKKLTVESSIGFHRLSPLAGKELIRIYGHWEREHKESAREALLLHHREDIDATLALTVLHSFTDFFNGNFKQIDTWRLDHTSCTFQLTTNHPMPYPVQYKTAYADIALDGIHATISVPVYEGELKYFLPGPVKDYYYLPQEDQAVHRSVACYVDKTYRQKATAATCYIRQKGVFLRSGNPSLNPHFQEAYHSKEYYILCSPDEWAHHPETLIQYITSVIV